MKKLIIIQCKKYFYYFSNKKVKEISNLFSEDIQVNDWNVKISGKNRAIKMYNKIFKSTKKLKIKIIEMHYINKVVFAQLVLNLHDKKLYILDIIKFNNKNKISSIKAYKQ
jgi:hypothetical protein